MIPVTPAPEPPDFDSKVRQPGTAFLTVTPYPTGRQWDGEGYWRAAINDLYLEYSRVCAYSGSWTHAPGTGGRNSPQGSSVDHFIPKSVAPSKAYEWTNFRLCRARLNGFKDNYQDVLDPFTVQQGWFQLNFQTFLIYPDPSLPQSIQDKIQATIDRLRLNNDRDYVNERSSVVLSYCQGCASFTGLKARYPFIAAEMDRQDFDANYLPKISARLSGLPTK